MVEAPHIGSAEHACLNELEALARAWRGLHPRSLEMRLAQQSYDEDFLVRMAYNSNAIEGSTLTLAETEVVYEGEFVPGKPGREQVAARGIFEGAAFMDEKIADGASLNETLLRDLHEQCALDLQPAARGMYRNAPAIIRASRTTPSAPMKIREEMANLFYRHEVLADSTHPLVAIPWFHAALESIHPFADGNGRTGRLWMNAQLAKAAYPPICIKVANGAAYKSALEAWQVDGDPKPFLRLFFASVEEELERRIDFLSQGPQDGASLAELPKGATEAMGIIQSQPTISAKNMGKIMGISERQAQRIIRSLREAGLLERHGASKGGTWVLATGPSGHTERPSTPLEAR